MKCIAQEPNSPIPNKITSLSIVATSNGRLGDGLIAGSIWKE